jgi:hypothetical protein
MRQAEIRIDEAGMRGGRMMQDHDPRRSCSSCVVKERCLIAREWHAASIWCHEMYRVDSGDGENTCVI